MTNEDHSLVIGKFLHFYTGFIIKTTQRAAYCDRNAKPVSCSIYLKQIVRSFLFGIIYPKLVFNGIRLGNIGQTADIVNADMIKHSKPCCVRYRNVDSAALIP